MNAFFSFLKFWVAMNVLVILVFLVLLAMPKSRLRAIFLTTTGWVLKATAAICLLYVISPLDLVPDGIPVAGYLDDLIIGVFGVLSGIGGFKSAAEGRNDTLWLEEYEYRVEGDKET